MKRLITSIITSVLLIMSFAAVPLAAYAAPIDDACEGLNLANSEVGACNKASAEGGFKGIVSVIVNVLTIIVGAVSVIMIIIGGLRYVVSNGDSNAMSGAKNTIMYAVIGLVIALSAQLIVAFVINKS